jgi:hypothetical protein
MSYTDYIPQQDSHPLMHWSCCNHKEELFLKSHYRSHRVRTVSHTTKHTIWKWHNYFEKFHHGSGRTTSESQLHRKHDYYAVVLKRYITRAPPVTGTLKIADSRASMQPFNAFECSSSINSQSSKWVACRKHPSLT